MRSRHVSASRYSGDAIDRQPLATQLDLMLGFFARAVEDRTDCCAQRARRPAAAASTFRCPAHRRAARARRERCRRRARDRTRRYPTESAAHRMSGCRCRAWRTRRPTRGRSDDWPQPARSAARAVLRRASSMRRSPGSVPPISAAGRRTPGTRRRSSEVSLRRWYIVWLGGSVG